jgi:OTU-like cysteine protease
MATLNEVLAYKAKFNKKPEFYKRKNLINIYRELAEAHLKNDPMLLLEGRNINNAYKKGNYKEYVAKIHKILNMKKAEGFFMNFPTNLQVAPGAPNAPAPAPAPAVVPSPNVRLTTEHPQYVAKATMKEKEDLANMYKRIKIVAGIKKVYLRNPGNQFAVIARKDKNEANEDVEKYRGKSLRLDIFVTLGGKNATLQFYSSGTVLITGQGDESSLKSVAAKFNNIENVKLERETGTFDSGWRINFNNDQKVREFIKLCYSKKYDALYEPELQNPIVIGMHKTGERQGKPQYKHNLLFQIKGGIQFNTSDIDECKKLLIQLLKDALKKGILSPRGLRLGKNSPIKKEKKKTTCKNPPTPDTFEGDCAPGYYCRPNAQGFPCCYKIPENLTIGRRTAIAAYKKFGIAMPEKVKKLLHIVVNVNVGEGNKKNNVVLNKNKGIMIRKRACMRYSVEELSKFAKSLGIDLAKEKKKREALKKKLPEGGWKKWLCLEMGKKLIKNNVEQRVKLERVSGSGSASSRQTVKLQSSNKPIIIEKNNRTHKLTILSGPPIVVRGFVRLDKRRKVEEITQRRCDTLDRDTLEKIARRLGFDGKKFHSKAALCKEIYNKRKNIRSNVPANSAPFQILKAKTDGNCFYEAFLRGLTGGKVAPTAKQITSLRKKVQTYYTTKYEKLPNNYVVDTTLGGKAMNKKTFLEYVVKNGSWAGQAEIKAVSRTMKTNVIVMTPQFKIDTRLTQKNAANKFTVYILYNGVNHFDTLIPKGAAPRVSLPKRASSGPRKPNTVLPNVVGGNLFASSTSTTASERELAAEIEAAMMKKSSSKNASWGNMP